MKVAYSFSLPQCAHTEHLSPYIFYKLSKKPYTNCTELYVQSMQFLKGHNSVNWKLTFSPAEVHLTDYCYFCSPSQLSTRNHFTLKVIHKQNGHEDFCLNKQKHFSFQFAQSRSDFTSDLPHATVCFQKHRKNLAQEVPFSETYVWLKRNRN